MGKNETQAKNRKIETVLGQAAIRYGGTIHTARSRLSK